MKGRRGIGANGRGSVEGHQLGGGALAAPAYRWGLNLLAYLRSSSDEQSRSCLQQAHGVTLHAREEGLLRPTESLTPEHNPERGVFVDDGVSGWKLDPEQRPGSADLLRFCEENRQPLSIWGIIIIWSLSRLGRFRGGPEEAIYWIHRMRRAGWKVRSITQPGLDSDDEDRLMAVIRTALESEKDSASSEEKSRLVSRGKQDRIALGSWAGGTAPWGYDRWAARVDGTGEIEWVEHLPGRKRNGNPDTVTVLRPGANEQQVRLLFELYGEGKEGRIVTQEELARRFNTDGVPTYRGGEAWYHTTIGKILTNDAYRGVHIGADGRTYQALWEPLVTPDLWDRVQTRLAANHRRGKGANSSYLLSGLLHCADCGGALHGDKTDDTRYYKAQRTAPGRERCVSCRLRVRADEVEPAVFAVIPRLADHPICRAAIEEERAVLELGAGRAADRRREVEEGIRERRNQITRLVDSLSLGGAAAQAIQIRMMELNREIESLEREQARLRAGQGGRSPAADRAAEAEMFNEVFSNASPAERKELITYLVARIDLDRSTGGVLVNFRRPPLLAA